jgi:hypothetical protein
VGHIRSDKEHFGSSTRRALVVELTGKRPLTNS